MDPHPDRSEPRDEDPATPAETPDPFDEETVAHRDPDAETIVHRTDLDREAIVEEPGASPETSLEGSPEASRE